MKKQKGVGKLSFYVVQATLQSEAAAVDPGAKQYNECDQFQWQGQLDHGQSASIQLDLTLETQLAWDLHVILEFSEWDG